MDFVNVLLYCWLVLIKWPEGEDLLSRRVPVSGIVPDQFCEQFFEQNIDFPAEKKLLAKCEQNIEILMKIDPKASQPGDTISFFSNVLYGTCLTTGRWRRSRSSGRGLSVRTRVRVCTRIDKSKPLHQAKYRQNEAMPSKIQAKYRWNEALPSKIS